MCRFPVFISPNDMQQEVRFFLFGDSICYGQLVSSHQTWATALAEALFQSSPPDRRVLVQNAGVNGNTTRQALERMQFDVCSHRPELLMVQFGLNDCNYWRTDNGHPRVSPRAFVANLIEIVEKGIAAGARHCFLNTNHPTHKGQFQHSVPKSYEQSNREYNALVREAAGLLLRDGRLVTLVDVEAEWDRYLSVERSTTLDDLLLADGVHLSVRGHKLYSDFVVPKALDGVRAVRA